jgi:hypothetical protein
VQERCVPWITAQRDQERVPLDQREATVVLLVCALEPLKCQVLLATLGVGIGNLVRGFLFKLGDRYIKRAPGFARMMQRELRPAAVSAL